VRALYQALHRYLCKEAGEDPDDIRILLCAPTGKAAYNINGVTLHNAFYIQPSKGFNQSFAADVRNTFQMKYRNLSIVIIDEISMVGKKMFSFLDTRLKKIKGNNQSFGGVSILAVGDLLQLKPVFDDWIFNDLDKGITALAPNLWKDLFSMHELTEIRRQKDDLDFAQLLNRLRENILTE
jgi:ATP-dependent exoDNAse (exonuclease V) alpha subunit